MSRLKPLSQRLTQRQRERRTIRRKLRALTGADDVPFGLLTIDRHAAEQFHGRHLHVFLDGEDVTRRCFVADDRQGYAGLFLVDEEGRRVVDRDGVAVEICHGDVRISVGSRVA